MKLSLTSVGVAGCCLALSSFEPPTLSAQGTAEGLFAFEAEVFVPRAGATRLELPAEVLQQCKAELADLRLFDPSGRPIAYAVVRGPQAAVAVRRMPARPAKVLEAEQRKDGESPRPEVHEAYTLALPGTTDPLRLRLKVKQAEFTRQVRVSFTPEALGHVVSVREASVFRSAQLGEQLEIVIGRLGPGRVRIELDGQGEPLVPSFEWEGDAVAEPPAPLAVALTTRSLRSEGGRTFVVLERPAGIVPSALRVSAEDASFKRQVHVFDADAGRRLELLGRAPLERAALGSEPRSMLDLPLHAARGTRLEVEIEDGDSPSLSGLSFTALVEAPTLVFVAPEAAPHQPNAWLRFGGGRVRAVRYDLSVLFNTAPDAASAAGLAALPLAQLGTVRADASFQVAPPLHETLGEGAWLDASQYAHRRHLEVPPSSTGVFRVALEPEDLAVVRADLADVRIVDGSGRQRAYVLVRDDQGRRVALTEITATTDTGNKTTLYTLELPASPLAVEGLSLAIEGAQFDRPFELRARDTQGRVHALATGQLIRKLGGAADDVVLDFGRAPASLLELTVQDGDDAPLRIAQAHASLALPTLYFAAAAGQYSLLLGQPQAESPRYELSGAADTLLAIDSAALEPGELEPNRTAGAAGTLALLQRPGGVVEVSRYAWVRECNVPASRDGVARLLLTASDLAVLRDDLADVRVVDAERRQRPYVLQLDAAEEALPLRLPQPTSRPGKSRWTVELPVQPVRATALALTTGVPFFDRPYQLSGRDAQGKEHALGEGRLSRRAGTTATELVLPITAQRLTELTLEVEDGADAALGFEAAELRVPVPALHALVPAGQYAVVLGWNGAEIPAYEVQRERELVLSVQSAEATLGPLHKNPQHGAAARVKELATGQVLLWIALAVALVALTAFTFRLVRREG